MEFWFIIEVRTGTLEEGKVFDGGMVDTNFFLIMKTQIPKFESFKYLFWNLLYMIKVYITQ